MYVCICSVRPLVCVLNVFDRPFEFKLLDCGHRSLLTQQMLLSFLLTPFEMSSFHQRSLHQEMDMGNIVSEVTTDNRDASTRHEQAHDFWLVTWDYHGFLFPVHRRMTSVQVAVRVRPFSPKEEREKCKRIIDMVGATTVITDPSFFDRVEMM